MPFDPVPQEPATLGQKIAALIEIGRASNPDIQHGKGAFLKDDRACAMGYAFLALGIKPDAESIPREELAEKLGANPWAVVALVRRVAKMNDGGAALDEVIAALQNDTLPHEEVRDSHLWAPMKTIGLGELIAMYPPPKIDFGVYSIVSAEDVWVGADWAKEVVVSKVGTPKAKVRTSAKTGATWPVAKHAYA